VSFVPEIEGPEESVYAGGVFKLKIQIPERCVFNFFFFRGLVLVREMRELSLLLSFDFGGRCCGISQLPVSAAERDVPDADLPPQHRQRGDDFPRHPQPPSQSESPFWASAPGRPRVSRPNCVAATCVVCAFRRIRIRFFPHSAFAGFRWELLE